MSATAKVLRTALKRMRLSDEERQQRHQYIAETLLRESHAIGSPDFSDISERDLQSLFNSYDTQFFDGLLTQTLNGTPLEFRVSSRMTRAGGKTSSWRKSRQSPIERFEIAVSSTLLFQTFTDEQNGQPVLVTGLECQTRLDALMRIMEHELVHLAELLGWASSSCTQERFRTFAWQIFGHTDHRHALITPRQQAAADGIRPGARVRFEYQGQRLSGIVNRITRRATVLVPSADGELFSDGNTYARHYVPLSRLDPVSADD